MVSFSGPRMTHSHVECLVISLCDALAGPDLNY